MVACELEQKDANAFPGVTLFTKRQAPGMKPTAVYLPPKHPTAATKFDVVIWLHGFYVKNHEFLFQNDPARLREQVRDSGKDVVLIAPFLGYEYAVGNTFAGNYSVSDLATANWGERYLEEILGALAGSWVSPRRPFLSSRSASSSSHATPAVVTACAISSGASESIRGS
ncbi:hypothetical protein [Bradyrhizobium sp. 172]|uniref:hypothetical protein n=1 Tax=Bradyrhizobium sp. 172 TaxID=2782643 RepID=UPI001FFF4E12|nr:hypothetical protein [Bradyrhizobium sp. 172]